MTTALTLHSDNNNQMAIIAAEDGESILAEILDMGMAEHELPIAKVPGGGGTVWDLELLSGDASGKELDVIVAYPKSNQRSYHIKSLDEAEDGGSAPDCQSEDGREAYGRMSEDEPKTIRKCEGCPMNSFGSAKGGKGKGKACSEKADLLCFIPGELVPIVVRVPAMSLKPLKKHRVGAISMGKKLNSFTTRLTLKKVKASPDYSVMEFAIVPDSDLSAEGCEKIERMSSLLQRSYAPRSAQVIQMNDGDANDEIVDVEVDQGDDWTAAE